VNLQSEIHSLSVDSEVFCGSISTLLDKRDEHGASDGRSIDDGRSPGDGRSTGDMVDVDTASSTYCEVQLATAMQWSQKQRMMILLEQFLASSDDGQHDAFTV